MTKLITKIYGVKSRWKTINELAVKLSVPEENIFLDDRPNGGGSLYTAKKAYLSNHGSATHGIFLQDDVEVCSNFLEICEQIVETHPDKIVSLFPFELQKEDDRVSNLTTPYVMVHQLSACGIIMPVEFIKPCFDYIEKTFDDDIPDDTAIAYWAKAYFIDKITTIPSLIQHIGDISVLDEKRPIRRTVYYDANPVADWTNKHVDKFLMDYSNFAPTGKNVIKVK